MATCKERTLRHLKMGKQLTVNDICRLIMHGRSTVKTAIKELRSEGLVKVASKKHSPLGGLATNIYAWSGKEGTAAGRHSQGEEQVKRFTAYRRNISQRDTHNEMQKNADHEPQFEGVIWSDGTVTLRWLTACRSTSVWASIKDCLNIHGHPEYGTEIVWHDAEAPQEWTDQVEAELKEKNHE